MLSGLIFPEVRPRRQLNTSDFPAAPARTVAGEGGELRSEMSERIKCKWCCGTGTIPPSGYALAHRCTDCGGHGYMLLCEKCGKPVVWDEGQEVEGELWCNDCAEGRGEDGA